MQSVVEEPRLAFEPLPHLVAFVRRLNRNWQLHAGPEQRAEARRSVAIPVRVQPIDKQGNAVCSPIAMVASSISISGIGLVHDQPIMHERVAIQLLIEKEDVILAGEIRWRDTLGPFYRCGCQVVEKLVRFPVMKATPAGPNGWTDKGESRNDADSSARKTVRLQENVTVGDTTPILVAHGAATRK